MSLEDSKKGYKREYSKLRYYLLKKKISQKEYTIMLSNIKKEFNIGTNLSKSVSDFKDKFLR